MFSLICNVSIQNAQAAAFIFQLMNGCPWETVQCFVAENLWFQWGGGAPEPPTSWQILYQLKFELSRPDAFYNVMYTCITWWTRLPVNKLHASWVAFLRTIYMMTAKPNTIQSCTHFMGHMILVLYILGRVSLKTLTTYDILSWDIHSIDW